MRTQQRVELRLATAKYYGDYHRTGTVSRVFPDGAFKVSFDSYEGPNGKRVSGGRFIYPPSAAANFNIVA